MNKPFPYYIEDWILWLAKLKDASGADIKFGYYAGFPVRLANYDVTFVSQTAQLIHDGRGLTDRQVDMAVKIITKYRKQILRKITVDPTYLATDKPLRLPLRSVNRSYEVNEDLDKNVFIVRFPYGPPMVTRLHQLKDGAGGEFVWDKPARQWTIARTERNLALVTQFVDEHKAHNWYMPPTVEAYVDVARTHAADPFLSHPQLDWDGGQITLKNENEWITAAISRDGLDLNASLPNSVIRAGRYGLRVSPALAEVTRQRHPNIANALLWTQAEIVEQGRVFTSTTDISVLEELMHTVDAKKWVFLDLYPGKNPAMTSIIEAANLIEVPGEKIFFTGRAGNRLTQNTFFSELAMDDLDQAVIILDSTVAVGTSRLTDILSKPILKMIHVFG